MVFDLYEQSDLYKIAGCARQSALETWLQMHRIPYSFNAKGKILVHKKAFDAALGAPLEPADKEHDREVVLNLEE